MRVFTFLLATSLAGQALAAQPVQSLDEIRNVARRFVAMQHDGGDGEIRVGQLDPRLRLSACGSELDTSFLAGGVRSDNKTVRVVCPGPNTWSLYVPVSVQRLDRVVVLARPVEPGALLSAQDLRVEEREIGRMTAGYFTDPGQLAGKKMRRAVGVGQPVTRLAVASPKLLRRGQRVVFVARAGGIEVRMEGEMLMDGAAGDRVRVRNLRSNRIVEGELGADGLVVVQM